MSVFSPSTNLFVNVLSKYAKLLSKKVKVLSKKVKALSKFLILLIFSFSFALPLVGSFNAYADFPTLPAQTQIIPDAPSLAAKSYLLMDFLSGRVIFEQEADNRVEPASLTKMMTVYVADQALKNKKITLNDKVKISEKAWRASGSRMFVDVNTEVPVEELLKGIIIQSGNDASIALAEHIAGDEATFVQLMNHFAKQLGMNNSNFVNSTGLPDPNHYTTARDMALLGKALIRDFPESYSVYSQKEFSYKNIKQTNRNRLLWQHDWVDGIKTGHTESAGYCLVASGKQEGMRLIAVIMGTKNDAIRTEESNKMLTYGFRFFETRKLYPKGSTIKQTRVWMGKEKELALGLPEDLFITIGRGQYERLQANIQVDKVIKAPIVAGAVLGNLIIKLEDKTILERPIVALQDIPQANIFSRTYDSIVLMVKSFWDKDETKNHAE